MTLSLMIKKKYIIEKLIEQAQNGTFYERREYNPFWRKRIGATSQWSHARPGAAVFLCGKYAFWADVRRITIEKTPPTIKDVVTSSVCYSIECKFSKKEFAAVSLFVES